MDILETSKLSGEATVKLSHDDLSNIDNALYQYMKEHSGNDLKMLRAKIILARCMARAGEVPAFELNKISELSQTK